MKERQKQGELKDLEAIFTSEKVKKEIRGFLTRQEKNMTF